jgi:hypothetical protein
MVLDMTSDILIAGLRARLSAGACIDYASFRSDESSSFSLPVTTAAAAALIAIFELGRYVLAIDKRDRRPQS